MAREIFNPNLALFVSVPEGGTTFQPNPNSIVQNDTGVSHLEFFKFVGRVVGKALYDGQLMDAYFTRSFYKHMLGEPLTYEVGRDKREGRERGDEFVGRVVSTALYDW
jgi:E3 ubiquitin-protein ligase HUWE1